jgi:hypothetical protein
MIDIKSDELLTFSQAAKRLPGRPHSSTIWRWHMRGVRGIRLETVLIGGRRYTSVDALQLFVEQTTASADGTPVPSRTSGQRRRAIAAAKQDLEEAGI